jgi:AcrR family transcriptional regulator
VTQVRTMPQHRERLLRAGDELMGERGNFDFGVRDVVERAQVSLRTFYQYFETRDDFALAIYAELIRQATSVIGGTMPPRGGRPARFRHLVHALVCPSDWARLNGHDPEVAVQRCAALVREGFYLREARPDGYKAAIAPLRELLAGILGAEADTDGRNVSVVLNSLMIEPYDVIIDGLDAESVAEHLYRYHKRALGI